MNSLSTFQIYNASAGSGKTFTLVKEYLKVLLTYDDVFTFQKILAITFTNKAANEMKERVLLSLEDFANGKESGLLSIITREIKIEKTEIKQRSKKILEAILQNYSAFSITTIDSFTHKIIKNFAFDLGLSLNFEVEMDAVSLLNKSVDVLMSKIGTDKKLTKTLINYSLDKLDNDKSWDVSLNLKEYSKVLLNEDDVPHFRNLLEKKIDDFLDLKLKLNKVQKEIKNELGQTAEIFLTLLEKNNLERKDFYRGSIPKFFEDVSIKCEYFNFLSRKETIDKYIKNKQYYTKTLSEYKKQTIEELIPDIKNYYSKIEQLYGRFILNKLAIKSIIPLAVLNNINLELETIKEENNIRLNAEFNQLISDNIKDQPTPFIYEKIGQRFQHYFIDEMQDTSVLQWQNLIPLIGEALAQKNSSLILVGDGKQAIYRWRGGKAEQLIDLSSESKSSFHVDKEIKILSTNYRSFSEIINFNNSFFKHVSKFINNKSYKNLYLEGNNQLENDKKGGYVSITFLDKEDIKDEANSKYQKTVLEKINKLLKEGFELNEICVLTRKRKEGVKIASYLSQNGINIVSSETLLLRNSPKVCFIIDVLKIIQSPFNEEVRFEILNFLYNHLHIKTPIHTFISKHIKADFNSLLNSLKEYEVLFNLIIFNKVSFYEKIEEIIRGFKLSSTSDAYLQFFLDLIIEQQAKGSDIDEFLEFWDVKKDDLSMSISENTNAVQIMTIHKSKGLEFPVVIFPCTIDIYRQISPKSWLDELPEDYKGFKELLVDYGKNLKATGERGLQIYNRQREELELDSFNLLYVALTRAVEQLFIITENSISSKGEENINFISGIFINYLKTNNLWRSDTLEYNFGDKNKISKNIKVKSINETHQQLISNPWKSHNIFLLKSASNYWNTEQKKSINYGNLLHEILSKIITVNDLDPVINQYLLTRVLDEKSFYQIKQSIYKLINHPRLEKYFSEKVNVFNERQIIGKDNQIIIPDRLIFINDKEVALIDYKTGNESKNHRQQLLNYKKVLNNMGYAVKENILVYIDEDITFAEI